MKEWIITNSPDDAFYYLQLADGKTSWFETNGYQPLWAIIVSFLGIFFNDWTLVYVTLFLYFFLILIIPFIVWRLFNTKFGFIVWTIPALFTGNLMMELPLTIILIITAYKFRNEKWSTLLFYSRLDTLFLALFLIPRNKWKRFLILIAPYFVFNIMVFHSIIPDGARHIGNSPSIANWTILFLFSFSALLPLSIIGAFIRHKLILSQTALTIFLDSIRSSVFQWHLVTLPVILIFGTKEFSKRYPLNGLTNLIIILFATLTFITTISFAVVSNTYSWQTNMYDAAQIQTGKTRGAYNSGIQGYFSDEKIYNLDGVFSHEIKDVETIIDFASYIPDNFKSVKVIEKRSDGLGDFGIWE